VKFSGMLKAGSNFYASKFTSNYVSVLSLRNLRNEGWTDLITLSWWKKLQMASFAYVLYVSKCWLMFKCSAVIKS